MASIPPTRYSNPKDHFTIHGTSDGKPRRNDNKVKLRRNPQFEGMVINCYVRMDWVCVVPVSILFWWMEMEHQLPRHQLMLRLESMEKLLAYLEMKERNQFHLPACIQPHPAARPSITEESEVRSRLEKPIQQDTNLQDMGSRSLMRTSNLPVTTNTSDML